jgi:hypothetical protein
VSPEADRIASQFVSHGWAVVELADPNVAREVGDALLTRLRTELPDLERLDDYHLHVDDAAHEHIWWELANWYWDAALGRRIVESELAFLRAFVGLDLHVQRYPYLRIARPGRPDDVTGVHRDTNYGASPYEVSMFVPLTDLSDEAALRVVSGSHVEPPEAYPATRHESPTVELGSVRHRLGFPYAPQVLAPEVDARAEPVPLRVGQALVFGLGLVHGQAVNAAATTRVSTDIRVVNSMAPVRFARGVRTDYYEPLCSSAVTAQAQRHLGPSGSCESG